MYQLPLITEIATLKEMIQSSDQQPLLLFKHSTQCPISAKAHEELEKYSQTEDAKDVKIAIVHVIENRPVSNEIADYFGIKHESPQAIWIKDGNAKWHASHRDITKEALQKNNPNIIDD